MKKVVAHLNQKFFARSETFIYNYVSNQKKFEPICISDHLTDLSGFIFPAKNTYSLTSHRFSPRWLYHNVLRRLYGREAVRKNIFSRRKVKLMHAHFGPRGFEALELKRDTGLPLVTTFYGYDMSAMALDKLWVERYKKLFEKGDLFLVEGNHMKESLISLGCPENKISIQKIAIEPEKIPFDCRKAKPKGEKVIFVSTGRFVEKKGFLYVLKALKALKPKKDEFEFWLIGDGPLRNQIENFVNGNRMHDCVKLLGFLKYDEYINKMNLADVFVQPSVTASDGDTEGGAPTTILEAQALGMPVITTRHADIPNIVLEGVSALISEEKDVEGLASNIRRIIEDRSLWLEMGRAGRDYVENHHNVKYLVDELEKKYEKLIYAV